MKLTIKKISQKGFLSLHILLPAVIAIAAIGGVGAYVLTKSHAASSLTSSTCYLRGRVWTSSGTCSKTCISGAGSPVVASPYDYCSNALSKISYTTCTSLGRKWLDVGCARRWQQTNLANAPQCATAGATYVVTNPYDKCSSVKLAGSCSVTFNPTAVKPGGSSTVTLKVTNSGTSAFTPILSSLQEWFSNGVRGAALSGRVDYIGTVNPGSSQTIAFGQGTVGFYDTVKLSYSNSSPSFSCSGSLKTN